MKEPLAILVQQDPLDKVLLVQVDLVVLLASQDLRVFLAQQ